MNKVILIGNLGADPELKSTAGGNSVCNLRLATSETFKDKTGAKVEKTSWHAVTVWGPQGENCAKYLTKGRKIAVDGRIEYRTWDKTDGTKGYATDIIADRVEFLGGGKGDATPAGGADDGEV